MTIIPTKHWDGLSFQVGYEVRLDPSDIAVLLAAFGDRTFQDALGEVLSAMPAGGEQK